MNLVNLEKEQPQKGYRLGGRQSRQELERRLTRNPLVRDFRVTNFDIAPPQFQVGNGLAVVTTGIAARMYFPCGVTIYQWTILADASGSIQFDLWVDSHANAPPTVADTITASAKPLLSSAQSGQSNALTGWTTLIKAGSWMIVYVDSVATIKQATLCLSCRKGL